MSTAFTPAPWQRYDTADYATIIDANGENLAMVKNGDNATLMAAAPEMFESLTTTVTFLKNNGFYAHPAYKKYIAIAEAAIAKASGKKEEGK